MTSFQSALSEKHAPVQASLRQASEAKDAPSIWAQRLSLAAGGLAAVGLVPGAAEAAIQFQIAPPQASATYGINSAWNWDVDGNGTNDFILSAATGGVYFSFAATPLNQVVGPVNANGTFNVPVKLNAGVLVGSAAPAGPGGSNQWLYPAWQFFPNGTAQLGAVEPNELTNGLNYFGFRFQDNASQTLYGWGEFDINVPSQSIAITRWAYNTVANAPIAVGDTGADPVPGPLGLAGLAAGAAWSRKLRRRIRESA